MIQPKEAINNLIRTAEKEPSRLHKYRMDRNERTHPFSESFMNYIRKKLTGEIIMTYSEIEPLYERFSKWLGVDRNRILFHSGSDLAIKAVFETYIRPKDRILLHLPGYAMYKVYAQMFQAQVDVLEYDSDLRFNLDQFIDALNEKHRMVVIENPNGYVGNKHPIKKIEELIEKAHRLGVIALVDEAYFHFIDDTTTVDFLDSFDNLIVVRTFSKAFGLAGLRAAYLVSLPKNIQFLYRVKPMHELNSMAVLAISALLDYEDEFRRFIEETKESLHYLKTSLNKLGIATSDSCANFLAARFGAIVDGAEVVKYLQKANILIRRPFREKHLKEWLRVGTAPLEVEKLMIKELEKFLKFHLTSKKANR